MTDLCDTCTDLPQCLRNKVQMPKTECTRYRGARKQTNFQRITANPEALWGGLSQMRSRCWRCGKTKGDDAVCDGCRRSWLEWLEGEADDQ